MPNLPISGLNASAANLTATDLLPVVQTSGVGPVKMTGLQLAAGLLSATTPIGSGPILSRGGSSTLQLGAADVASGAVAQTLQVQSNTGAATTGPNFTIKGSSGTTAGGSIIFQTHNGTAFGTALTIASDKSATFGGDINIPLNGGIYAPSYVSYVALRNTEIRFGLNSGGTSGLQVTNSATNSGTLRVGINGLYTWSNGNPFTDTTDLILARDNAGILALKNSTNAQIFRVYSTTASSGSYGIISAGVQPDGATAAADTLYIGSAGAGNAMTKLALVVNGTTRADFNIANSGIWTFQTSVRLASNTQLYFSDTTNANFGAIGGSILQFQATSLLLNTFAGGTFSSLQFGGTTASFPAIKRSLATLQVRLADDSGDAALQCGTATSGGTAFNVNGTGGSSIASITNTSTGTLLQVLNSTSNPLMTVTDTTTGTLFSVQSPTAATLFSVNDTTSGTLLAVTNSSSVDVFTVADTGAITGYDGSTANTVAIRNGTTAQRLRVYNTASGTNNADWEAVELVWSGNIGYLQTNKGGAGTQRLLYLNGVGIRLDPSPGASGTIQIDTANISTDGTTGSKIGTATSQKLGFWNATPIVQPTTGVAAATVASTGTGDVVAASTTFDGYTIPQVVKALRNAGLLA